MIALFTDHLPFHLRAAGVLLLALSVLNLFVPRRFNWHGEMARLSLVNRQIFLVHSWFIILILVLFAALLLICTRALLVPGDTLARAILIGLTLFWFLRLLTQWFVYDWKIWRGHRFNTAMHFLFSCVWLYFTLTFSTALWMNLRG